MTNDDDSQRDLETDYISSAVKYLHVSKETAEDAVVVGSIKITLESTEMLDKLSLSILAFSLAALALSISGAKSTIDVLGSGTFHWFVWLMLLSAFFGFCAKLCRVFISTFLALEDRSDQLLGNPIGDFYDKKAKSIEEAQEQGVDVSKLEAVELNFDSITQVFKEMFRPKDLKSRLMFDSSFAASAEKINAVEPSHSQTYKFPTLAAFLLVLFLLLQTVFMVVSVLVAVIGLE